MVPVGMTRPRGSRVRKARDLFAKVRIKRRSLFLVEACIWVLEWIGQNRRDTGFLFRTWLMTILIKQIADVDEDDDYYNAADDDDDFDD